MYIGNSTIFRFTPWTVSCGSQSTVINHTFPVYITASSSIFGIGITPAYDALWSYSYSIIGNTMYVNYQYLNSSASGASNNGNNGMYVYIMPITGFKIDNTILVSSNYYGQLNEDFGSQVGNCSMIQYGQGDGQGPVRITNINNIFYLYLMNYQNYGYQSSGNYSYTTNNINITFVASFPITPA